MVNKVKEKLLFAFWSHARLSVCVYEQISCENYVPNWFWFRFHYLQTYTYLKMNVESFTLHFDANTVRVCERALSIPWKLQIHMKTSSEL